MNQIYLHKLLKYRLWLLLLVLSITAQSYAQLGFCTGNSGDPIFMETFGTGSTTQLPTGTTSYTYNSMAPDDGFYNVSSNTNWFGWHDIVDHTPNVNFTEQQLMGFVKIQLMSFLHG